MMGDSQILPMSSNRKQDYELGLWSLAEHYPRFLNAAPREALDALLKITSGYVTAKRKATEEPLPVKLDDLQSALLGDYSSIWAESIGSQHDNPIRMLQAFQSYLEKLIEGMLLRDLVRDIATHEPPAVFWRLLLTAGTKHPASIGHQIRSLAWDHTILTERDTTRPAGAFLQVIYPLLPPEERGYVEQAIMEIPAKVPDNVPVANKFRDRLLGCLDRTLLTTPEAIAQLATLEATGGPPPNPPDHKIEFSQQAFTQDDFLRDSGVPVDDPEHQRILGLTQPIADFGTEFLNDAPPPARVRQILPIMRALDAEETAIRRVHPQLRDQAVIDLLRACDTVLRSDDFAWDEDSLEFIKTILLRAAADQNPEPDPEHDEGFQESLSYGTAPRIDAARAIMSLAQIDASLASDLQPVIIKLAEDPVANVRFEIANRLTSLFKMAPELMWHLLEQLARREENRGVLQGVTGVLQRCAAVDPPRIAQLTLDIFDRIPTEGPGVEDVRHQCSSIFAGSAIWNMEPKSIGVIERMLDAPAQYHRELGHVIFDLSAWLQNEDDEVRHGAFTLLSRILDAQITAMQALETKLGKALDTWQQTDRDTYGYLMRNADEVATRLHLTSGATSLHNADPLPVDPVFYENAKPLLKSLASMGHPHTAHSVIETLVYFSPLDPVGGLLLIGDVIRETSAHGYQYEQLGEELIVRLVERYLAEYCPVLREHRECHTVLMEILDVFVRVGWPRAHQLTYRLNEIYR